MDDRGQIWFVDGYHNGPYYGIPPGSWRDIADALDRHPCWKIILDVEPHSWVELKRHDPRTWERLLQQMRDPHGRIELGASLYAQPYCWVIDGESNLRHLVAGRRLIDKLLPGVSCDTYCTQEPCWTTALPAMLLETGYVRAVLRDPGTAFSGYMKGRDIESFLWQGPDGTALPCVGRYGVDGLVRSWEHESRYATREFARRCRAAGIAHPVGTGLQDVGWHARPSAPFKAPPGESGSHITFVTWREYFQTVAAPPAEMWQLSQEDFQVSLPWGDQALGVVAGHTRRAEVALRRTEKFATLAFALTGAAYDAPALIAIEHDVMHCQHHDSWVCARWPRRDLEFFDHVLAQSRIARNSCGIVQEAALDAIVDRHTQAHQTNADTVFVFNSEGAAREDFVEFDYALPPNAAVHILDGREQPVPFQMERHQPTSQFSHDANDHAVRILARVRVPGFGWSTLKVMPGERAAKNHVMVQQAGHLWHVESDHLALTIDAARGGAIVALRLKLTGFDFCRGDTPLGAYRAYLCAEQRFASSCEQPAQVRVIESGPLRVKLEIAGQVGPVKFIQVLTIATGQPCIDVAVTFDFTDGIEIGDREGVGHVVEFTKDRRQSWHDGRYKLNVLFPSTLQPAVFKDAAFDVCRSKHPDTFFNSWDDFKHHVLLNWADAFDATQNKGLAILADRTSGYLCGEDHPFGLILVTGRKESRPVGTESRRYAIVLHDGDWQAAGLWSRAATWRSPLKARVAGACSALAPEGALISIKTEQVELVSAFVEDGMVFLRLFNASDRATEAEIELAEGWGKACLVTAMGDSIAACVVTRRIVRITFSRMAYRTLRLSR